MMITLLLNTISELKGIESSFLLNKQVSQGELLVSSAIHGSFSERAEAISMDVRRWWMHRLIYKSTDVQIVFFLCYENHLDCSDNLVKRANALLGSLKDFAGEGIVRNWKKTIVAIDNRYDCKDELYSLLSAGHKKNIDEDLSQGPRLLSPSTDRFFRYKTYDDKPEKDQLLWDSSLLTIYNLHPRSGSKEILGTNDTILFRVLQNDTEGKKKLLEELRWNAHVVEKALEINMPVQGNVILYNSEIKIDFPRFDNLNTGVLWEIPCWYNDSTREVTQSYVDRIVAGVKKTSETRREDFIRRVEFLRGIIPKPELTFSYQSEKEIQVKLESIRNEVKQKKELQVGLENPLDTWNVFMQSVLELREKYDKVVDALPEKSWSFTFLVLILIPFLLLGATENYEKFVVWLKLGWLGPTLFALSYLFCLWFYIRKTRKAADLIKSAIFSAALGFFRRVEDYYQHQFTYVKCLYEIRLLNKNIVILEDEIEKLKRNFDRLEFQKEYNRSAVKFLENNHLNLVEWKMHLEQNKAHQSLQKNYLADVRTELMEANPVNFQLYQLSDEQNEWMANSVTSVEDLIYKKK